jgi:putative membrane protein
MNESAVLSIERPAPALMRYYLLRSFLAGPAFIFPLIYLSFRYRTMRYRFDDEGVTMRWGILFRREISLTYARIQDIHLTSNLVERWLRLARVQIQTASASSTAEMTVEGVHEFEAVRDFLYSKMRGVRAHRAAHAAGEADVAGALLEVARELRAVREALERRP